MQGGANGSFAKREAEGKEPTITKYGKKDKRTEGQVGTWVFMYAFVCVYVCVCCCSPLEAPGASSGLQHGYKFLAYLPYRKRNSNDNSDDHNKYQSKIPTNNEKYVMKASSDDTKLF